MSLRIRLGGGLTVDRDTLAVLRNSVHNAYRTGLWRVAGVGNNVEAV